LLSDGTVLKRSDLRFDLTSPVLPINDTRLTLVDVEQKHIADVLREEEGHVERAALRLGIPRSSLYQKIKRYGITVPKI
jgi:transcriptional regulator of acetoin/glycerol metabolism